MNEETISNLINNFQANKDNIDLNKLSEVISSFSNNNENENQKINNESNGKFDISSILNTFTNDSNNENSQDDEFNFDFSAFQKILQNANRKDSRKDFLIALKPFLKKERREKLNQYITYLTIANALGIFKGDDNNDE